MKNLYKISLVLLPVSVFYNVLLIKLLPKATSKCGITYKFVSSRFSRFPQPPPVGLPELPDAARAARARARAARPALLLHSGAAAQGQGTRGEYQQRPANGLI